MDKDTLGEEIAKLIAWFIQKTQTTFIVLVSPIIALISIFYVIIRQVTYLDRLYKLMKQIHYSRYNSISHISIKAMRAESIAINNCLSEISGICFDKTPTHVGYYIVHNGEFDLLKKHLWKYTMLHEKGRHSFKSFNENIPLQPIISILEEIQIKGYSNQDKYTKIERVKTNINNKYYNFVTYFSIIIDEKPIFIISVGTHDRLVAKEIEAINNKSSQLYAYFQKQLDEITSSILNNETGAS